VPDVKILGTFREHLVYLKGICGELRFGVPVVGCHALVDVPGRQNGDALLARRAVHHSAQVAQLPDPRIQLGTMLGPFRDPSRTIQSGTIQRPFRDHSGTNQSGTIQGPFSQGPFRDLSGTIQGPFSQGPFRDQSVSDHSETIKSGTTESAKHSVKEQSRSIRGPFRNLLLVRVQ
jgi:hypothetical protein